MICAGRADERVRERAEILAELDSIFIRKATVADGGRRAP